MNFKTVKQIAFLVSVFLIEVYGYGQQFKFHPETETVIYTNKRVYIGLNNNPGLRVRHIDGMSHLNTGVDHLFLNWNRGKDVYIGKFGGLTSKLLVSGNVGIGTTNPTAKLHVKGNSLFEGDVRGGGIGALNIKTNYGYIKVGPGNENWAHFYTDMPKYFFDKPIYSSNGAFSAYNASNLKLQTNGTTHMTVLKENGNVGIGTTQPNSKLDINAINYSNNQDGGINLKAQRLDVDIWNAGLKLRTTDSGRARFSLALKGRNIENSVIYDREVLSADFSSGYIGIGNTVPKATLHVKNRNTQGVGVRTENADLIVESKDAHLDIISDSSQTWGSAINFVEAETTANTDIWSIYRQTTNGSGDSSLRFNFGTSNATQANETKVAFLNNGDVGIGTTNTKGFKLGVNGKIAATEVKVALYNNWSDFVFYDDYKLPTLKEVETHISEKGHLQNIPSAEEVAKDGFFLGEMDAKLLQKIEELTLYTIQQEKKIEKLETQNKELKELSSQLLEVTKRLEKLESK